MEYNIFNTDIDPGGDFVGPDSREAFINVSSGPGFRKPGPGSSHDSSYVLKLYKQLRRLGKGIYL